MASGFQQNARGNVTMISNMDSTRADQQCLMPDPYVFSDFQLPCPQNGRRRTNPAVAADFYPAPAKQNPLQFPT